MKKITSLFLLIIGFTATAQNIDYEHVTVSYTRLPMTPVNKSIKNFQALIVADYLQKIEQQKSIHQASTAKADADYMAAMKQYNETHKQDSISYETRLNVWFRLTPQQQAVTPRPEMTQIPAPVKVTVADESYEKTFNTELLASTALKLEGFNRLPDKALIIQVNLSGFENDEPKIATQKKQVKGADGKTADVNVLVYQFNYRHLLKLKIIQPDGKYMMDEVFPPSLNYITYSSKDFPTQAELEAYWKTAKTTEMASVQEKVVNDGLHAINEMLNNNYGYVPMTRVVPIAWVNEKKGYDDFRDAMNNAKNGYLSIGKKETNAQGEEYLRKATTNWENAMKESDPKNKKARVDEDVTESLLMDLSEAYIWLNDFTKAQEYLTKLDAFKLSMKEKNIKNSTKTFLSDQSIRIVANKGN